MTVETSRPDIVSIQMLRAVAALMVVTVHVDLQLLRQGYAPIGLERGSAGVDIFFVISGFIMWYSTERTAVGAGAFMLDRIIRIVPLYWAVTGFVILVLLIDESLLKTTRLEPWHAIASFAFLPARHPLAGEYWPLVVPGWTLNFEMVFYALFALALVMAKCSPRAKLYWSAGFILGFLAIATAAQRAIPAMSFYASTKMIEFLLGIVLAVFFMNGRLKPSRWWLVGLAIGFAVLSQTEEAGTASAILVPLLAALIVTSALLAPVPAVPGLRALGDASYALYITHAIVLAAVSIAWARAGLADLPASAFVTMQFASAILGALITYRLFELPFTRGLRSFASVRPALDRP